MRVTPKIVPILRLDAMVPNYIQGYSSPIEFEPWAKDNRK